MKVEQKLEHNVLKRTLIGYKTEFTMLLLFAVFFIAMSFASEYFLTQQNILNILSQISANSMLAIGMTFVIITGGIDLSVSGILGLSGMVGSMVLMKTQNIPLSVAIIFLVSIFIGLINGLLIGYMKMPAFIVTMSTCEICRSLDYVISNANTARGFPEAYQLVGKGKIGGVLPVYVILIVVLFGVGIFILSRTKFGRYTYAIGSNAYAAELSGINVKLQTMLVYVYSGFMCAFGAWIMTSRLMACDTTYGNGNEMDAIAAAVIGGVSMSGGKGTLWGTFIGIVLVGCLRNALNLLGMDPYWQGTALGVVIIMAVLAERLTTTAKRA